jgi:riboflavin kinase/FMN adenylyltransferase
MMRIVQSESGGITETLARIRPTSHSYVTVGVFDGVHRGHQRLIARMVEAAHSARSVAIAITFTPHPGITLGFAPPPLLTTVEERAELLATLKLDVLVVLPFTPTMVRTSATDFVELLKRHLDLVALWGGPDFSLGHRREGTASFLQRLGTEMGFTVHLIEPLAWEGTLVNSSRIRTALEAGDVAEARGCLGRPYRLAGQVARGCEQGRRTGMSTVKLSPPPERLVPANGVYACLAHAEHLGTRPAVVSIGARTAAVEQRAVIETCLLDSNGDFHGQALALDFIARLRGEPGFLSPDELTEQFHKDVAQAVSLLGKGCLAELPDGG